MNENKKGGEGKNGIRRERRREKREGRKERRWKEERRRYSEEQIE